VDAEYGTGAAGKWSSSRTGDNGEDDMGGIGKDSRCMLSAGRETGSVGGETEGSRDGDWVVMLTDRGEPGGVKRRLFTLRVAAFLAGERDVAGFASERLRPCRIFIPADCLFGTPAGLRSPELFDRTSDTVASFIRRSDASGLLPPLRVFRRDDSRDPDGDGCGDRNGVDDDSSSSMSTAFSSRTIPRSSGDGSPRLVSIFTARLRGEMGGEGPSVSLGWAMEDMTRKDSPRFVWNKYGAVVKAMNHFESTYLGLVPRSHIASLNILKIAREDGRGRVNCANY
jgi:hypothetical protein